MNKTTLGLLLAFLSCASAHAHIDLTPVQGERVLEGIRFPQLSFSQNGRTITYEQPRGWTYSGGGDSLRFIPPNVDLASAEIQQSKLRAAQPFDEENRKALQAQTTAAVPPESKNVALVSEVLNPFRLGSHDTYEVIVSFEAFGQAFMMGVIYVNLPDTQLRFRTLARQSDFEKVHAAFRGSMFSWAWAKN